MERQLSDLDAEDAPEEFLRTCRAIAIGIERSNAMQAFSGTEQ